MNEGICGDVDQNDKFWPKFINTLDRFIQGIQKPNREVTTNFCYDVHIILSTIYVQVVGGTKISWGIIIVSSFRVINGSWRE